VPEIRDCAWSNRGFHQRAAKWIAEQGVRQFIDMGSGLPTVGNTHEVVQNVIPGARVVYVDNDPMVAEQGARLLADDRSTRVIRADLREPDAILGHADLKELIDFSQPAGLLLVAVLHFIASAADPWRLVGTLRDALAPGSYLVLGQATSEGRTARNEAFEKMYNRSVATSIHLRSRAEIERFFDGFQVVDPGVVFVPRWRPDAPADVPGDASRSGNLVGVARRD
jgi:SAM-dependent methyltransferase